ncbi:MAG: hypothetical protein QNJ18_23095 [Xenococcaceae cyanobacterium MO_167.B52]|nr:hypothetical protein [Xenococcaceae cyanobacterium MO_167.B52]
MRISLLLCLASFTFSSVIFTSYWNEKQQQQEAVLNLGQEEVSQAAQQINALLQQEPNAEFTATDSLTEAQIESIRLLITSLSLGKTGYGYLLDEKGTFLYHPLEEFIKQRTNVFERAQSLKSEEIRSLAERGIRGEKGVMSLVDPATGEASWVFYHPVSSTKGFIALLVYQDEVSPFNKSLKRKQFLLGGGIIVGSFFLIVLVCRAWTGQTQSLWIVSVSTALLLAIAIGYIWYFSLTGQSYQNSEIVEVNDPAGLQSFLDEYAQTARQSNQTLPIYIPTGIFLQTLKFQEANNVFVSGYIWQKHPQGTQAQVAQGFMMPDAITATDLGRWIEVYRHQEAEDEVIGWYFEVTLRQRFDYTRYPFDSKEIRLRLLPQELTQKTILVPDLASYTRLLPRELPGLQHNILLPGWKIHRSFFEYQFNDYDTNFGLSTFITQQQVPELYFTVVATRNFITVFISNFMPIIVITFMMFGIQLIISNQEQAEDARKFSALEIISVGGGLIFIVLLDQLNLRSNIVTASLIYIEYIYFVFYFAIILITLNAVLIALGSQFWLIRYRDNLIPKLLYWPVLLGVLLVLTLLTFY